MRAAPARPDRGRLVGVGDPAAARTRHRRRGRLALEAHHLAPAEPHADDLVVIGALGRPQADGQHALDAAVGQLVADQRRHRAVRDEPALAQRGPELGVLAQDLDGGLQLVRARAAAGERSRSSASGRPRRAARRRAARAPPRSRRAWRVRCAAASARRRRRPAGGRRAAPRPPRARRAPPAAGPPSVPPPRSGRGPAPTARPSPAALRASSDPLAAARARSTGMFDGPTASEGHGDQADTRAVDHRARRQRTAAAKPIAHRRRRQGAGDRGLPGRDLRRPSPARVRVRRLCPAAADDLERGSTRRGTAAAPITVVNGDVELRIERVHADGRISGRLDGHRFELEPATGPAGFYEQTSGTTTRDGRSCSRNGDIRGTFIPPRPRKCRTVLVTSSSGQQQWVTVC